MCYFCQTIRLFQDNSVIHEDDNDYEVRRVSPRLHEHRVAAIFRLVVLFGARRQRAASRLVGYRLHGNERGGRLWSREAGEDRGEQKTRGLRIVHTSDTRRSSHSSRLADRRARSRSFAARERRRQRPKQRDGRRQVRQVCNPVDDAGERRAIQTIVQRHLQTRLVGAQAMGTRSGATGATRAVGVSSRQFDAQHSSPSDDDRRRDRRRHFAVAAAFCRLAVRFVARRHGASRCERRQRVSISPTLVACRRQGNARHTRRRVSRRRGRSPLSGRLANSRSPTMKKLSTSMWSHTRSRSSPITIPTGKRAPARKRSSEQNTCRRPPLPKRPPSATAIPVYDRVHDTTPSVSSRAPSSTVGLPLAAAAAATAENEYLRPADCTTIGVAAATATSAVAAAAAATAIKRPPTTMTRQQIEERFERSNLCSVYERRAAAPSRSANSGAPMTSAPPKPVCSRQPPRDRSGRFAGDSKLVARPHSLHDTRRRPRRRQTQHFSVSRGQRPQSVSLVVRLVRLVQPATLATSARLQT